MASGIVQRAPVWLQNIGMEWGYRLIQEPGRLWRRYVVNDLPMVIGLLLCAAASRKLKDSHYTPGAVSPSGMSHAPAQR